VDRAYHTVCQEYTEHGKKYHGDPDDHSSVSVQHLLRCLDIIRRNTGKHHAENFVTPALHNGRGHFDIMVCPVIKVRTLAFHTADYVFRYICLAFIQAVCILDHPEFLIDDHNPAVI